MSFIFDFDAYGTTVHLCLILAARRAMTPGECIGLVLTEGSRMNAKLGSLPVALAAAAGLRRTIRGSARSFDDVISRAIGGVCERMGCRLVKRYQAKSKSSTPVTYIGLVLERVSLDQVPTRLM